jgi:hypothetical protein
VDSKVKSLSRHSMNTLNFYYDNGDEEEGADSVIPLIKTFIG